MANGAMTLADLAAINRARGEFALSGQAGEPDIPELYALRLALEGAGGPIAGNAGSPFAEEPGGGDVIPGLALGVGATAAPVGAGAGAGGGGSATLASLGGQPTSASFFPRGGEGNRRGTDTSQPTAFDPSDPFQSFMDQYFGAIKDPTLMGRLNPLTGGFMNVSQELQEDDPLGALFAGLKAFTPAALSGLLAGLTFGPEVVAPAAAQQLQPGSPLSVIEMILSRSQGGRDAGPLGATQGVPGLAIAEGGQLSQISPDVNAFAATNRGGILGGGDRGTAPSARGSTGPSGRLGSSRGGRDRGGYGASQGRGSHAEAAGY